MLELPHPDDSLLSFPLLPAQGTFSDKLDFAHPYLWWFAFNQVKGLPEQMLAGRVRVEQNWCPWVSTGAVDRWCSRRCRAARGCAGRRSTRARPCRCFSTHALHELLLRLILTLVSSLSFKGISARRFSGLFFLRTNHWSATAMDDCPHLHRRERRTISSCSCAAPCHANPYYFYATSPDVRCWRR